MSSSRLLVGAPIAAIMAFGLAACSLEPPAQNAAGLDDQYGIPAGSVPPSMLKPDGSMSNGLMPAQPYDTGG